MISEIMAGPMFGTDPQPSAYSKIWNENRGPNNNTLPQTTLETVCNQTALN